MPEPTVTCLIPSRREIRAKRSSHGLFECLRWGQRCGARQLSLLHFQSFEHEYPYMLAVGPPTSEMCPRKAGSPVMRRISCTMEDSLRLLMRLPWCRDREQKEQPETQP